MFSVPPLGIVTVFAEVDCVLAIKLPIVVVPVGTVRLPIAVVAVPLPGYAVPSVTALDVAPRFPPVPTEIVPLLMATGPLKVLLPVRLRVPGPVSARPLLPAMAALTVGLRPLATLTVAAPL